MTMEKFLNTVQVYTILTILPLVFLSMAFVESGINEWILWRALIGLAFLILAGVHFATALAIENGKEWLP